MFKKGIFVCFMILAMLPCSLSAQEDHETSSEENDATFLVDDDGEWKKDESSLQDNENYDSTGEGNEDDDYEDEDGVQWDFGGKIESVHGLSLYKNGDYIASRNFVTGFVGFSLGSSYAKISASAEYNYRNEKRTGFRLNEAYYKYRNSIFELCMGRQHIVWGQADGFTLTNVIPAKDKREFTSVTSDDSLLPSDAIRLKFFHDIFTFEALAIPFFTPDILPPFSFELGKNKSPFYIELPDVYNVLTLSLPISYSLEEAERPRKFLDTEFGGRFSFFLPRIDFSFSLFYGWEHTPMFLREGVLHLSKNTLPPPIGDVYLPTSLDINIKPLYYRILMAGTDGAVPLGDVLLRYEVAYVWGRHFEPKVQMNLPSFPLPSVEKMDIAFNNPIKKHQLLMLLGLDWNYRGWMLSAQYYEDVILDHNDDITRPIHQGNISLNISKTLLRETLKLGATVAIGVNYGDTFSTYSIDYAITDNFHIGTGFDIYTEGKDGKGQFANLKNMSSYWLKGRFSF